MVHWVPRKMAYRWSSSELISKKLLTLGRNKMTEVLVIDTNVLEYLFNNRQNEDKHIDLFLEGVVRTQKRIGFDKASDGKKPRILSEYEHRLRPYLEKAE